MAAATDPLNLIRIMPAQGTQQPALSNPLPLATVFGEGESGLTQDTSRESGKIAAATFRDLIAPRLGAPRAEVVVGPRNGVDGAIIDLGAGQVMAITTDPFFVMPELGWERAGWFAVHIVASDAATSGLRPAYLAVDLNLPHSMTDGDLAGLWQAVHQTCRDLGMAIVTGHTARYDGCTFPMLGGATVVGLGAMDRYVTPAMAGPGDLIIVTKGAAIETTGMFGVIFSERLTAELGRSTADAAAALFWQMSVVKDALTAVQVGVRGDGITAMHDATERGVWGGLVEIAEASGVGMIVEQNAILLRPEARAVCEHFAIDPFITSSEGTLLLTCRPHRAGEVIERLAQVEIAATCAGEILPPEHGIHVVQDGKEHPLHSPHEDPFWPALQRALEGPISARPPVPPGATGSSLEKQLPVVACPPGQGERS